VQCGGPARRRTAPKHPRLHASAYRPANCRWHSLPLAALGAHTHPAGMFVVTEADAAAIRAAFDRGGELSAAVELPGPGSPPTRRGHTASSSIRARSAGLVPSTGHAAQSSDRGPTTPTKRRRLSKIADQEVDPGVKELFKPMIQPPPG
jgi:hypothetical protein